MTTASKITLVRVALIPVYMVLMYLSGGVANGYMYGALALFIIASVTDFLDGYIARKYHQVSDFGKFLREMKLERVGAFAFSPQEGSEAFEMEYVDEETAQKRAEILEMIQSGIMDEYNEAMIGKTVEVLVEGYDEEFEQSYGRTYADSPDIDGRVWIASDEPVNEGEFIKVCIDGLVEGDLVGYIVEEE